MKKSEEVMIKPFLPLTKANLVFIALKRKLPECKSLSCVFNKNSECWNLQCYSWWNKKKWQWVLCSRGIYDTVLTQKDGFHKLFERV